MRVVVKQHINSAGHKSKPGTTAFSSLLDKFEVNAKDADDVVASETTQIYHAAKHNLSCNSLYCT